MDNRKSLWVPRTSECHIPDVALVGAKCDVLLVARPCERPKESRPSQELGHIAVTQALEVY